MAKEQVPASSGMDDFNNILLQVNFDNPQKLRDKATGLKISKAIYSQQTAADNASLSFFVGRAADWDELELWAKGMQDMSQFRDYFNVSDGNKAYVKLDETPVMVGAQFIETLVGSISKNYGYPCVTAIDDYSRKQKADRYVDALYRMNEAENINEWQQQGGVILEDPMAFVPDDEQSARVYFELEDRLPKEIRFEKILDWFLNYNDYEKVYKRRALWDIIVKNIECNKIEKLPNGQYYMRKCVPQNLIYNYFQSDNGKMELGYIGERYHLKIRDLRKKYGVSPSNPKGLTEKDLYDYAKISNQGGAIGFGYEWKEEYNYNTSAPWDEVGVLAFDFEINLNETEYHVSKKDSFGKENITAKKGIPSPTSENATVIKKDKNSWYRGIFCPAADKMIYWGDPEIKIFPYLDYYNGLSSYTINIPNNDGRYVPSLFKRALEPLREYALLKLKRKQLISKIRPSGIRIDVESARNTNLGGGNTLPWEETIRIYDQTGNEIYSSRGVNPNERENPAISAMPPDNSVAKVIETSQIMDGVMMEIRSLLGVPIYRDGSDVGDRTAARLAEGQNKSAFNVTDFVLNAHHQCLEETLYKICILKWQDAVKSEKESDSDLINTKFDVKVEMKATEYERELLERDIAAWSQILDADGYPVLRPKDALQLRGIKGYKSQILYLDSITKSRVRDSQNFKIKLQEKNIQDQQASAKTAADEAKKLQDEKLAAEKEMKEFEANNVLQQITAKGALEIFSKILAPKTGEGGQSAPTQQPVLPDYLDKIFRQTFENISITLYQDNKALTNQFVAQEQQEQAIAEQQMIEEQAAMQEQIPQ